MDCMKKITVTSTEFHKLKCFSIVNNFLQKCIKSTLKSPMDTKGLYMSSVELKY